MTTKLSRAVHIALLVAAAIALTLPFLVWGLPPGHDREVHIEYQHFFNQQMDRGDLYPRWMPGLNLGRGSPIFFVQYPLPYYVAWGLGHLIPNHWGIYTETHTLGLGVVLATILGALFTYAWCTTFADNLSAMIASIVFLTLPYLFSIDLYVRGAVGEVWALTLMPLAFYFLERRSALPRRSLAGLAAVFALVLLSHLFTAVLLGPVLLAYAAWNAEPSKRFSALLQTTGALALGFALAGVYTLPLFAHRHFLHPENLVALSGSNYSPLSQMFPYDRLMFPRDTPLWYHLGLSARYLAAATICVVGYDCYRMRREGFLHLRTFLAALSILTLGLTFLAGHLPGLGEIPGALPLTRQALIDLRAHIFLGSFLTLEVALLCYWSLQRKTTWGLSDFLIGTALLSYLMTTRWSLIIWNAIHPLWTIQFPWRFNVLLAIATAGLAALATSSIGRRPLRERVLASFLGIVVWGLVAGGMAGAGHVENPFSETRPVANSPARDSALPVYAQVKNLDETLYIVSSPREAKLNVVVTSGKGKAEVNMPHSRRIELQATCESDCTLQIGQFYYPAWRATLALSGTGIPLRAASPGGMMEISLPPGENKIVVELPRGRFEQIGPAVSLVSLILVILIALSDKPRVGELAANNLTVPRPQAG
jgi:hypothetical protein